jgi:hypothetical protein
MQNLTPSRSSREEEDGLEVLDSFSIEHITYIG